MYFLLLLWNSSLVSDLDIKELMTAKWTAERRGRQEAWDTVCWLHVRCAGVREAGWGRFS